MTLPGYPNLYYQMSLPKHILLHLEMETRFPMFFRAVHLGQPLPNPISGITLPGYPIYIINYSSHDTLYLGMRWRRTFPYSSKPCILGSHCPTLSGGSPFPGSRSSLPNLYATTFSSCKWDCRASEWCRLEHERSRSRLGACLPSKATLRRQRVSYYDAVRRAGQAPEKASRSIRMGTYHHRRHIHDRQRAGERKSRCDTQLYWCPSRACQRRYLSCAFPFFRHRRLASIDCVSWVLNGALA